MADQDELARGRRASGAMLTMSDIARLANVSKPTVSRVLNGSPLVTPETRDRVLEVARANGYVVNRNAQKLRHSRTNTVAVVLDFGSHRHGAIGDPFIFELLAGISEALSVRDQDVLLSPPGLDDVNGFRDLHRARGADGFIVLGQGARVAMLRDLARTDVPFVVWGAVEEDSGYCAVGSDNRQGGRLAGERFVAQGRRRFLFVGDIRHAELRLRYEGLKQVADAHGIPLDHITPPSMAYAATMEAARDYLVSGKRPDAVFAFSDTGAMAVISTFRDLRYRTPGDYSIIGYNDIPPAAHFTPAISTIAQETGVAGSILVEKLMQLLDGGRPKSVMLPTRLIVRDT